MIAVHSTVTLVTLMGKGYPVARVDGWLYLALHVGWCGVDLFFVLSGFLITGILLRAKGRPGYYTSFYARRALRIMPLYYAVLLGRVALAYLPAPWLALNPAEALAHALYVGNFWQCYARAVGTPFDAAGLTVCWSLAIEEQFYLAWPLVVANTSRRWLARICAAGVVVAVGSRVALVAAHADHWLSYALTPCRVDALCLGALVALAAESGTPWPVLARRARLVLGLGLAAVAWVWVRNFGPFCHGRAMAAVGYTCFAAVFAAALCLILAAQPAGWRGLRLRPLRVLGAHSYAIYLVHYPVIVLGFLLFRSDTATDALVPVARSVGFCGPLYVAYYGFVIGTCLVLAKVSWVLIERPCLRLKRHFPMGTPADAPPGRARDAVQ